MKKITKVEETGKSSVQTGAENNANAMKAALVKPDEKDLKDADSVKQLRGKIISLIIPRGF